MYTSGILLLNHFQNFSQDSSLNQNCHTELFALICTFLFCCVLDYNVSSLLILSLYLGLAKGLTYSRQVIKI